MGKIHTRMMPLALAVALTACGGGGGGSASSGNGSGSGSAQLVTSTTLSGVAVDGYLQNAKVCLDLNDNLVCDSGEPSATTGANGSYSLTAPSLEAANSHRVIVEAVAGTTIDADAPGAPVTQGYVLVAPIGQHAVVSPIGTLVHHYQQQGLTLAEAQAQVRQAFALSAQLNLSADFAAQGASAEQQYLHNVARVVTRQLASGLSGVEPVLGRPLAAAERPQAVAVVLQQILASAGMTGWHLGLWPDPAAVPVLAFEFSNLQGRMAVATSASSPVSEPLSVVAGEVGVPSIGWNGNQIAAGYRAQVVKAVSASSSRYLDTEWINYAYDNVAAEFTTMPKQALTVFNDGQWRQSTGVGNCRHVPVSTALHVSCDSGWQADVSLHEFLVAGKGIDGALRHGFDNETADTWGVALNRNFSAGAKAYLVNVTSTTDYYQLLAGPTYFPGDLQTYSRMEDAMAAAFTSGGQRFFLSGSLFGSFDSLDGNAGEVTLYSFGNTSNLTPLPLKGQWRRKVVGETIFVEFSLPTEYAHRAGLNAYRRVGWTVFTPTDGSPVVQQYYVRATGSLSQGLWFNTQALNDLKAARATAL